MILGFRHKGLRRLFERGDDRGVSRDQVKRLSRMLDTADCLDDVGRLPGMRLHPLTGDLKGRWSLSVSGNWRIVFRFENGNADDVDLVDDH